MKKISLLLIFCFLFQGCVGYSSIIIGEAFGNWKQSLGRNKECNFKEILEQPPENKGFQFGRRLGLIGFSIVILLAAKYYFLINPVGLELYLNLVYPLLPIAFITGFTFDKEREVNIDFNGWKHEFATQCKENHFVIEYTNIDTFEQGETAFLKFILQYPDNYDISQSENFANFQKDFLPNNKIQIYFQKRLHYRVFRYIHYPGGKAKFEEDFGKYLFKP